MCTFCYKWREKDGPTTMDVQTLENQLKTLRNDVSEFASSLVSCLRVYNFIWLNERLVWNGLCSPGKKEDNFSCRIFQFSEWYLTTRLTCVTDHSDPVSSHCWIHLKKKRNLNGLGFPSFSSYIRTMLSLVSSPRPQFCELLAVPLHSVTPLFVQLQCYAFKRCETSFTKNCLV